jgi:hypothetical protein
MDFIRAICKKPRRQANQFWREAVTATDKKANLTAKAAEQF